jgi:hypothetical protein
MLDYRALYRLPFSKNDNFNGWIEITTCCNMRCPGCYRVCNQNGRTGNHKPLEAIERELDLIEQTRRPSMISISGGEALTHPELDSVVASVRARGMHPVLFTNGLLLTPERLASLKRAGLTGVVVRADALQAEGRGEEEVLEFRKRIAEMVSAADIFLTFTTCIDKSNLGQIGKVAEWSLQNAGAVGQNLWILKRSLVLDDVGGFPDDSDLVFVDELVEQIERQVPDLSFAAYLGSEGAAQQAKWLQAMRLVLDGVPLGWVDAKFVELLQMVSHYFSGRYVGIKTKKEQRMGLASVAALALVNKSFRKILKNNLLAALKNPLRLFKKASVQAITVVSPPHFVNGRRDLCDGCPDAIFHEGRLVPSCCLEEVVRYGHPYEKQNELKN